MIPRSEGKILMPYDLNYVIERYLDRQPIFTSEKVSIVSFIPTQKHHQSRHTQTKPPDPPKASMVHCRSESACCNGFRGFRYDTFLPNLTRKRYPPPMFVRSEFAWP